MRILIIDDSTIKIKWIQEMLEEKNIHYDQIKYLSVAYKQILDSPEMYDGIILDMQFPMYTDSSQVKDRAGEWLLKRLDHKNINIPVLGNSTMEFRDAEKYPFLKGNTHGFYNPRALIDFLESLKDGE